MWYDICMKKALSIFGALAVFALFIVIGPAQNVRANESLLDPGIFWDQYEYRLGINAESPAASLHVVGNSTTTNDTIRTTDLWGKLTFLLSDFDDAFFTVSLKVGDGGAKVGGVYHATSTLDFPATTLLSPCDDLTVSVEAQPGDIVGLSVPAGSVGDASTFYGYVSGTDEVSVRHCSAGVVENPASGEFGVLITRVN